jgi:hypothetical protein
MYLAVKVGEALAEASAGDVGDISLTNGTNIGSFVDTFYNEPAGTHPMSAITGTSVTTTLKQVGGSASETGSDFARPVGYYADNSNPGFYEMVDSDLDNLTNRALKNVETLGLQGAYELSTSSPGSDWTKHIDGVFSDTHGDGTTTQYHIWKKVTLATPPAGVTTTRPVATDYDGTSSFSGFKEMSDAEIKYTLGQRAKSLRATAGAIGSYQLRSSAQGAPTLAGTWVPRGSASNTRRTIVDVAYSRTRNSAYTRTRISAYTRNRISTYTRNSVDTFSRTFVGEYTGAYSRDFVGNYARDYVGNYARTRVSSYTRNRLTAFTGYFAGTYNRSRVSTYVRNRITPFTGTFSRNRVSSYTRGRVSTYTGTLLTYTQFCLHSRLHSYSCVSIHRNLLRTYSRNRVSAYAGTYTRNRVSTYARTSTRTRTSAYSADYTRTRITNYT